MNTCMALQIDNFLLDDSQITKFIILENIYFFFGYIDEMRQLFF